MGECRCGKVVVAAADPVKGKPTAAANIDQKLADLEQWFPAAVAYLIDWLRNEPGPLLAIANGRHAEGEYRYGSVGMYAFSPDELRAEASQELADGINYVALLLMGEAANPSR